MTINRHNYEEFLVDYLDGRLNPSLVAELLVFLDQNPDVKDELDGLQDVVLIGETIAYPNKSTLKKKSFLKNGIDDEFEYLCIASAEDILSQDERATLEKIIQEEPNKQFHYLIFQKTIINPDLSITFPAKSRLKRASLVPIRLSTLRRAISIAASVAIIIGGYTIGTLMLNNNPSDNYFKPNIAESTIPVVKTTTTEVQNKVASTNEKPIRTIPNQENISEKNEAVSTQKSARINIEESIPNIIRSIEIKEISIQENPQPEQLAEFVAKYATAYQVPNNYTQQESNVKGNRAKEVGVFEIIQYGVQSFGKLIGSDINLKANKDKKGNIEKINFESSLVAFSAPVRIKD